MYHVPQAYEYDCMFEVLNIKQRHVFDSFTFVHNNCCEQGSKNKSSNDPKQQEHPCVESTSTSLPRRRRKSDNEQLSVVLQPQKCFQSVS